FRRKGQPTDDGSLLRRVAQRRLRPRCYRAEQANKFAPSHVVLRPEHPHYDPITGIAGCCARAVSGHAATAPPSSAMNARLMPTFMMSLNWTDQGIRAVKDSPKRSEDARELAKKVGVEIKHLYLTSGDSDLVIFVDAPSGDNVAKFG